MTFTMIALTPAFNAALCALLAAEDEPDAVYGQALARVEQGANRTAGDEGLDLASELSQVQQTDHGRAIKLLSGVVDRQILLAARAVLVESDQPACWVDGRLLAMELLDADPHTARRLIATCNATAIAARGMSQVTRITHTHTSPFRQDRKKM